MPRINKPISKRVSKLPTKKENTVVTNDSITVTNNKHNIRKHNPIAKGVAPVTSTIINEDSKKLTRVTNMRKRIRKSMNGKCLTDQEIKNIMETVRHGK